MMGPAFAPWLREYLEWYSKKNWTWRNLNAVDSPHFLEDLEAKWELGLADEVEDVLRMVIWTGNEDKIGKLLSSGSLFRDNPHLLYTIIRHRQLLFQQYMKFLHEDYFTSCQANIFRIDVVAELAERRLCSDSKRAAINDHFDREMEGLPECSKDFYGGIELWDGILHEAFCNFEPPDGHEDCNPRRRYEALQMSVQQELDKLGFLRDSDKIKLKERRKKWGLPTIQRNSRAAVRV
ncbi:hypothetical protein VTJ49DRAFT_1279 [Mycothermus thermophilus]|uniref:Uncharacterized protein n=1 Tax=Humicola insolens TaxID=85995 RepID=A0ABR3VCU5_HUMIN